MNLRSPETAITIFLAFIIATTIHECMHAWTARRLGDDTAERLGRITLNPVMHFDPLGLFGMLMISLGLPFIGWGKPVPVNPNNFKGSIRGRQSGMALVALAGPLSNVAQALVVGIPLQIAASVGQDLGRLEFYMSWFVWVNVALAAFNMIPFPPLDGSKILMAILPSFWTPILAPLERNGFIIILLLIFVGGGSLLTGITNPVFNALMSIAGGTAINLTPPL
jgi:Zn-dependent protease